MPTYTYQCQHCKHTFEEIRSISSRGQPENEFCSECGKTANKRIQVAPPTLVAGVGETTKLMDNGWKEVMKGISKANPNNNIKDY